MRVNDRTGKIDEFGGIELKNTCPPLGTLLAGWLRQMFRTKAQRDAAVSTYIRELIAAYPNHPGTVWYEHRTRNQFPLRDPDQLKKMILQEMMRARKADHEEASRKFIEGALRTDSDGLFRVRTVIDACANDARRTPLSACLTDDELTRIAAQALIDRIRKDILDRPGCGSQVQF